jgi:phosphatidylethanolamine-binding protein (PEBP) family uncharacterized protein
MRSVWFAAGFPAILLCAPCAVAADMSVSFRWCDGTSPAFTFNHIPRKTAVLELKMVDRNAPAYDHGGGRVQYTKQESLPCGEFGMSSFRPPAPPAGEVHLYVWTVRALDKDMKLLDQTQVARKFPE